MLDIFKMNSDLPMFVFYGDRYDVGTYQPVEDVSEIRIEKMVHLRNGEWLPYDIHRTITVESMADKPEYSCLNDDEFFALVDIEMKKVKPISAVVIYVG